MNEEEFEHISRVRRESAKKRWINSPPAKTWKKISLETPTWTRLNKKRLQENLNWTDFIEKHIQV